MKPSSRTPEGIPNHCPVCGKAVVLEPSRPPGDAPCPHCGSLIWFPATAREEALPGFRKVSIADRTISTKREAITAMLDRLIQGGAIDPADRQEVLAAIMHREDIGSTGIGRGAAVPHGNHRNIREMVCAVATFPAGIEFGSLDKEPVRDVYLILSPHDKPGDHLRAVEKAARYLRG
jgi:PTS system fructose-specific IIA component/PTS system nitrogen regulatory IIA component